MSINPPSTKNRPINFIRANGSFGGGRGRHTFGGALPIVLAISVMILLAAGFATYIFLEPNQDGDKSANAADWDKARVMSFHITVTGSGELRAKDQIEITNHLEYPSSIVEIVDEGTAVNQGDILIKLADELLKEKIESATKTLTIAQQDEKLTSQTLKIEDGETQSALEKAQVTLEMADLDLQKWEKGDVVQKQRELSLALEKAKRTLIRAEETMELSQKLFLKEFISKAELEDDKLKLLESQEALKTAQLDIEIYQKYTFPKEKRKSTSDVAQAKASLERTKQKNSSRMSQANAVNVAAIETLQAAKDRLAYLQTQFEATEIKAPKAGLVVYASSVGGSSRRRESSEPIGPGAAVRFRQKLIYLPNTEHMSISMKVHEAMIRHVELGQKVHVTIDARPGKIFVGQVVSKGITAQTGSWFNPNLREYEVMVDLPKGIDPNLKPGMRSLGKILIQTVTDKLAVPVQAVHSLGKNRFCYVRSTGTRLERRNVKIGRHSETFVEILNGLKVGDEVLVRQPRPGEIPDLELSDKKNADSNTAKQGRSSRPEGNRPRNKTGARPNTSGQKAPGKKPTGGSTKGNGVPPSKRPTP
jgi:HlyD family secretion protein